MGKSDDEMNDAEGRQESDGQAESAFAKILRHWESKTAEEKQQHLDKLNRRRVEEKLKEIASEDEEEKREQRISDF
ncbi:MAG: hypothetical protein RBS37_09930 [Bacteroidales bacterium]|jgi:hypothetical protein|nr:hypothetical protein [Bacteroidales bacterium]